MHVYVCVRTFLMYTVSYTQLYHFKFPEDVSSVKVLVTSNTSICAIVSVQNATVSIY